MEAMSRLAQFHIDLNRKSQLGWEAFAGHRQKVTDLLSAGSSPQSSRLCVLGAGNCNDLDLRLLQSAYQEIHLVDLDAEALQRGLEHQGLERCAALQLHSGLDVAGMQTAMDVWTSQTVIGDAELAACVSEPASQMRSALRGPFEAVASTCLLSQLINTVVQAVGEQHPRFLELLQAVRLGHLRLLADLLAPNGAGWLITDVVSSDSFPALNSVAEDELPGLLAQLIHNRNFFHGVNPAVLMSHFHTDPVLSTQIAASEPIGPWRWDLGPRQYIVYAIKMRRG